MSNATYLPARVQFSQAFVVWMHKRDVNPVNHLPEGSDDELQMLLSVKDNVLIASAIYSQSLSHSEFSSPSMPCI